MSKVHNNEELRERRKELRKRSTEEENILWNKLRGNKLGFKFKRQHSVGGYILDFYCHEKRLIIEIDGTQHKTNVEYDRVRDQYFKELDYMTLRFLNPEIRNNLEVVLNEIKNYM
jgi:very-short-patch-repair endonuclease